jgi:hypothetical protein
MIRADISSSCDSVHRDRRSRLQYLLWRRTSSEDLRQYPRPPVHQFPPTHGRSFDPDFSRPRSAIDWTDRYSPSFETSALGSHSARNRIIPNDGTSTPRQVRRWLRADSCHSEYDIHLPARPPWIRPVARIVFVGNRERCPRSSRSDRTTTFERT